MPEEFPDLADGDELRPEHLNVIYRELRRLRRELTPPAAPGGLFTVKLTGSYSSGYPWKQVVLTPGGTAQDTGVTGTPAGGDPAYELNSGDTGLTAGDTVYQAARSPASNDLLFWGQGGLRIMYVTGAISKATSTAGTGSAKPATFGVAGANQLDPGSAASVTVKNMHTDKGFKVNCYIAVFPWAGALWAFDVDACANLS